MSHTALTAGPFSYSKARDTFRPAVWLSAATAAGLGGVTFIHDPEDGACVIALVGQHRLQLAPAGVEHRLGHSGLGEFLRANIAHVDFAVLVDQLPAEFMQGVLAAVGDLGVDRPDASFLACTLRDGQLRFQVPVEPSVFEFGAVAGGGYILEPQVDADGALTGARSDLDIDDYVEVPAAAGVLAEATGAKPVLAEPAAVPDLEVVPVVEDLTAFPAGSAGVDRYPTERAPGAARLSPREIRFPELFSAGDVLSGDALQSLAVQPQFLSCPLGVRMHVEGGQECSALANGAVAQLVQIVPHAIYAASHLA